MPTVKPMLSFKVELAHILVGIANGGYIYSFGVAREVRKLTEEFLFPYKIAKIAKL